jgi:hypothetical protein
MRLRHTRLPSWPPCRDREAIDNNKDNSTEDSVKWKRQKLAVMQRDFECLPLVCQVYNEAPNDVFELIVSSAERWVSGVIEWEASMPSGWSTRGASKSSSHVQPSLRINCSIDQNRSILLSLRDSGELRRSDVTAATSEV